MKQLRNYLNFIDFIVKKKPSYKDVSFMSRYGVFYEDENIVSISKHCTFFLVCNEITGEYNIHFRDYKNFILVIVKWLDHERHWDFENIRIERINQ